MKIFFCFSFLLIGIIVFGQDSGFPFGQITYEELEMKTYDKDTAAVAVVLNEYGTSFFSNSDPYDLIFEYHAKIKILKKIGFDQANFSIPLYKGKENEERATKIQASTFNIEGGSYKESKLDQKNIYKEISKSKRDWNYTKFTLPDIRVGSVIEVQYTIESPFYFNFRSWLFQSEIPKKYSRYNPKIPGNYIYNMTLRGSLTLTKNDSKIEKDCFTPGPYRAECAVYQFEMKDIPPFKSEDYMTARSNFLSSINFELSEVRHFDGRVDKVTKEWSDADKELKDHELFGRQIRKAEDLMKEKAREIASSANDPLARASLAFSFIKQHFLWNGSRSHITEEGVKKAFEGKKGNIADINLSLLGLLKVLNLEAYAALISTRDNGLPVMLHPVVSDFNYVVVRLSVNDKTYWLDATNPLHAFGFLPEQCLNGSGRLMKPVSEWISLTPADKEKSLTEIQIKLTESGSYSGLITVTHTGYEAFNLRKKYFSSASEEEFIKESTKHWTGINVVDFAFENLKDLEKHVVEKIHVNSVDDESRASILYFEPFLTGRIEKNPFRSDQRTYPVDFGATQEEVVLFSLDYPQTYMVDELPANTAVTIPGGGGRYLFSVNELANKITLTSNISLTKSVYKPEEYQYLKELFNRIVASQQSQIVLKKK